MRKFQKSKVPKFGDKIPMDDRSKAKGNSDSKFALTRDAQLGLGKNG